MFNDLTQMSYEKQPANALRKTVLFYNDEHYEPNVMVCENFVPEDNIASVWKATNENNIDANALADEVKREILIQFPDIRNSKKQNIAEVELVKLTPETHYEPHRVGLESDDTLITLYIAPYWNKEWGGEMIFFEETEASEVLSCVPARLVISKGNTWVRFAQPTNKAPFPLWVLQFKLV